MMEGRSLDVKKNLFFTVYPSVMLPHPRNDLPWGQEQHSWGQNPNPAVPVPFSSDTGLSAL